MVVGAESTVYSVPTMFKVGLLTRYVIAVRDASAKNSEEEILHEAWSVRSMDQVPLSGPWLVVRAPCSLPSRQKQFGNID
jgi:hypothetical protein